MTTAPPYSCQTGGRTSNLPPPGRLRWRQNYPGLARPALCGYRFYNQDVTTGSLLLEVGGHANTLDEAIRAGEYAARALAALFGAAGAQKTN